MKLFSTFIEIGEIRSNSRKGEESNSLQISFADEKYIKYCQFFDNYLRKSLRNTPSMKINKLRKNDLVS